VASITDFRRTPGRFYDNEAAPARVVACPATCARIQAAKRAQVDILFGCETAPLE
jgi:hypothetical protein